MEANDYMLMVNKPHGCIIDQEHYEMNGCTLEEFRRKAFREFDKAPAGSWMNGFMALPDYKSKLVLAEYK